MAIVIPSYSEWSNLDFGIDLYESREMFIVVCPCGGRLLKESEDVETGVSSYLCVGNCKPSSYKLNTRLFERSYRPIDSSLAVRSSFLPEWFEYWMDVPRGVPLEVDVSWE